MEFEFQKVLDELKDAFVVIMRKVDLDSSRLVKNTTFTYKDNQVVMLMPDYGIYVDSGRRKGARIPPISAIRQWIIDVGIVSQRLTLDQLSWAIAKSISKNGINPRPFLDQVHIEITQLLLEYIDRTITKNLESLLNKN